MKVCIVGGGLAGLAAAVSLAKALGPSTSSTSDDDDDDDKKSTNQNNNKKNKTNSIVMIDEIVIIEKYDFTSRGATLGLGIHGQISMNEFAPSLLEELKTNVGIYMPNVGSYMLPWYKVRDGLLNEIHNNQKYHHHNIIKIMKNTTITSIIQQEDNNNDDDQQQHAVKVTLEKRQQQQEQEQQEKVESSSSCEENRSNDDTITTATTTTITTMEFDLLIGADGVHSTVRQLLNLPSAVSSDTLCWRGSVDQLPDDIAYLSQDIVIAKAYTTKTGVFAIFNFNNHNNNSNSNTKKEENFISWVATSKDMTCTTPYETISDDHPSNEKDRNELIRVLDSSTKDELTNSTILSTIDMDDHTGWGGQGCITLIGDSAHALRPASGLGGGLAFEDVVLLTRQLVAINNDMNHHTNEQDNDDDPTTTMTTTNQRKKKTIVKALRDFESKRYLRCKTIVDDQTRISESSYNNNNNKDARKKYEWTQEYKDWVFAGPNANPIPPTNMYVVSSSSSSSVEKEEEEEDK